MHRTKESMKRHLLKKIAAGSFICFFALSGLFGCKKALDEALGSLGIGGNEETYNREENAAKLSAETRYYNDFLGVSYSVPKGWWLYDLNDDNFSESKGGITSDVSMDIAYGEFDAYEYSNLWLLSFGNLESSSQDNHLGFEIEARAVNGANDIASFMKYFEAYMLEPTDEAEYELTASEQISIAGKSFELRDYLVDRDEADYKIITLSCPVKEGYFFNIVVDYWPQNPKAKTAVIDSISKSLEFY